jgi:glutamate formiminotransferase
VNPRRAPAGRALKSLQPQAESGRPFVIPGVGQHVAQPGAGLAGAPAIEQAGNRLQGLIRLALSFGNRTACTFDIGPRAGLMPIKEQDACPQVDRVFKLSVEVVLQPLDQQAVHTTIPACRLVGRMVLARLRIGHLEYGAEHNNSRREVQALNDPARRLMIECIGMAIIECIANISEGRRADVLEACGAAIKEAGAKLLDVKPDATHHRTVFSFAGEPAQVKAATLALFAQAIDAIDLRQHKGEHPRLGAVDVVPFVPIEGATMADCVALAREVAAEAATRHHLPIYLYEEAASSPARRNLEDIRRGEFEGLAAKMAKTEWAPDFGPATPHASAGASVVGARMPLIAYNINLATDRLDVAKKIAAAVRHSTGGLRYVKAMGLALEDRGIVQVSMNLTNYEKTPLFRVFELVKREAERYGVTVLESEIIGLVPSAALTQSAAWYLQVSHFGDGQVLENALRNH